MSKHFTRQSFICPFFGKSKALPEAQLPSYADIIRCCQEERYALAVKLNNEKVPFKPVANEVGNKVLAIYRKSSIPTVSLKTTVDMIHSYYNEYVNMKKSHNRDSLKPSSAYKHRFDDFMNKSATLFDVASCKCPLTQNCSCKSNPFCKCKEPVLCHCTCIIGRKIPKIELPFLFDQRTKKQAVISAKIDGKTTRALAKKMLRQEKEQARLVKKEQLQLEVTDEVAGPFATPDASPAKDKELLVPQYWQPGTSKTITLTNIHSLKLTNTALTSQRYGVSDTVAAAITSSVLADIGVIDPNDKQFVIDRSKIKRDKSRLTSEILKEKEQKPKLLRGLYFDGRKDSTAFYTVVDSKRFRRIAKEEHYSLLEEPGSEYITHVVPASGCAKDITTAIVKGLRENSPPVLLEDLEVVGSDGTSTNTGWKGGVIHCIEVEIGRPVQWAICLLHFNELPFRHLFQELDGTTSGPSSFSGTIGQKLKECHNLPVVDFEAINCDLPSVDLKTLGKDQAYLYKAAKAVSSGVCPEDFAASDPGKINHARWLTTANNTLRLYMATKRPSAELKLLVRFLLTCYIPVWFAIKNKSSIIEGPRHLFKAIQLAQQCPVRVQKIVNPVIQTNSFFAHPENLLLTMCFDDRKEVRELAMKRILAARTNTTVPTSRGRGRKTGVRNFELPRVNFKAQDYTEMIDWSSTKISSPPILRQIKNEEIQSFIDSGEMPTWDVTRFPCHTQAVERCVKLVTAASEKRVGFKSRHEFITSTLKSREVMPTFKSKCQFATIKVEKP